MDKPGDLVPQNSDDEIPEELKKLIVEAGGKEVVMKYLAIAERFTGPVPHPRILKEYASIMPDAPKRIFRMAEKQQAHRIDLEKNVIKGDIQRADTGLILGFVLFLMFGIGSIILLALGKDIQGFALLGTSLMGGVGNFIRVGRERAKIAKKEPSKKTPIEGDITATGRRKRRNRHKK